MIDLAETSSVAYRPDSATRATLWLWGLIPVLYPFYLFDPGRPQISSAAVALAIIAGLFAGLRFPSRNPVVRALCWFLWYVCIVNIAWAAISKNIAMLMPPFFYLFNGAVMIMGVSLYLRTGRHFLIVTQHSFALAVLIQLILLLVLGPTTGRETIFFDNPNQLGYFGLVSAAVILSLSDRLGTPSWYRGAALGMCLFLVIVSTSFAAIIGAAMLVLVAMWRRPGILLLAGGAFIVFLNLWGTDLFLTKRVEYEQEELEGVSFMASRGYDRIMNHPEHIFVGAGEGNYRLYESVIGSHEIHSSYGTLLFCYGLVGTMIFIIFIVYLSREAGLKYVQYLAPVLLYGFAHQSLRSTMLWMFMAGLYGLRSSRGLSVERNAHRKATRSLSPVSRTSHLEFSA